MQNQSRIEELLSEMLKKQDRQEELLQNHSEALKVLVKGQKQLIDVTKDIKGLLQKHDEKLDDLDLEVKNVSMYLYKIFNVEKRLNDMEERLSKVENR